VQWSGGEAAAKLGAAGCWAGLWRGAPFAMQVLLLSVVLLLLVPVGVL
jgi:hypothetical protein